MKNRRKIRLDSSGVRLENKDDIQMYVYGGKGRFRLKSTKSGKTYEFKIKRPAKTIYEGYKKVDNPKYDDNILFISARIDETFNFQFIGTFRIEENTYTHSKKSTVDNIHDVVKGFKWLIKQFEIDKEFPTDMEFYHMGICGCCAKSLTTPDSIKLGIGPVCFKKFGNVRLKKLIALKKKMEKRFKRDNIKL
ncbi:MAG: DUF6011 domain-containing protein [bacterium]